MKPNQIFFRTSTGEQLAETHGREISTLQRRALLAVNGHSSVEELANKVFWVENLAGVLQELYDMGLISDNANTVMRNTTQLGGTGLAAQTALVTMSQELLGDQSEKIAYKIQSAPATIAELKETVLACKKAIKLTMSETLAEQFLVRAQKVLDEYQK